MLRRISVRATAKVWYTAELAATTKFYNMSSKASKSKKRDGAPSAKITDSRFASFETDPRYALPSKRKAKTTIDKRFARMLKDDDFTATAKVDRYGRKIKSDSKKKALQRLYQEEDEDEDDDEGSDGQVDDDDIVQRELEKADTKYDPARGGGFSSSESDSDSDSDDDDEDEDDVEADNAPDMQKYRTQQAEVETGEVTKRIAIVNIDWDHIKSVDLMALFKSFVPLGGRIEKVSIYPSEFGKERMEREELEGPPKEIFKKNSDSGDESEDDNNDAENDDGADSDEEVKNDLLKEGNEEDFDSDALRTYQLDRLRYYYAVMVCSNENTAQKIYEATDGSEYLSSSNFLDLRFVPDDVAFDDEPRDECESVPDNYKPVEFVTDALQHSKVKLTWDMHPEEAARKENIKNAFSGSRDGIAENDLRAYLASDSEDDEDDEEAQQEPLAETATEAPKLSKKELQRKKMREALGLTDEAPDKSLKSGPVGDMQITFAPALTEESGGKKDPEDETTAEKYIRKERERKAQRKEKAMAKREGAEAGAEAEPQEDLGFDDPFFTTEEPKKATGSAMRKEERLKKREAREAEEKQKAAEKAQLQLLMADNHDEEAAHLDHFDMNEIRKAEKKKNKKKGKKGKTDDEAAGLQEDFKMDVDDDRFKAIFDEHEFAIDPSNPKFKATSGMKKLLEEGRKKRKTGGDEDNGEGRREKKTKKATAGGEHNDLSRLVSSIKKKSGNKK